jgi:hypothetical protein
MKNISTIFLGLGILCLIFVLIFENTGNDSENNVAKIRKELERQGLPTPAFADAEKLKNILKGEK